MQKYISLNIFKYKVYEFFIALRCKLLKWNKSSVKGPHILYSIVKLEKFPEVSRPKNWATSLDGSILLLTLFRLSSCKIIFLTETIYTGFNGKTPLTNLALTIYRCIGTSGKNRFILTSISGAIELEIYGQEQDKPQTAVSIHRPAKKRKGYIALVHTIQLEAEQFSIEFLFRNRNAIEVINFVVRYSFFAN